MPEPSSPAPPPRVEWQVQVKEDGQWWEFASGGQESMRRRLVERRRKFSSSVWRLVRRSWRLESEEVVEGKEPSDG